MHHGPDERVLGDKILLLVQIEDLGKASLDMSIDPAEISLNLRSLAKASLQINEGISATYMPADPHRS